MEYVDIETKYVVSKELVEIPLGNRIAVYHRLLGGLTLLDANSSKALRAFTFPQTIQQESLEESDSRYHQLLRQLILRQFLIPSTPQKHDAQAAPSFLNKQIHVIQLVMANACNFGCKYCFEGIQGKEMSAESEMSKVDESRIIARDSIQINLNDSMYASTTRFEHQFDPKNRAMKPSDAIKYTENALDIAKSQGVNEVMIQFFGGEPMLNWKAIKAVLDRFNRGENDELIINYSIVTNSSLFTDEIAQIFAKYEVATCVSFDSPTSPNRPLKNGDDSTPTVVNGLQHLKKYNNRIAINAALTSSTWHEFDNSIVDFAKTAGASEIGVIVDFDPTFYANFGTENIINKLWSVIEYGRDHGVILTGYWHQIFQVMLGFDVVSHRGFKNCSAKGAQLSIEPNGSVFSCKAGSTLLGKISEGEGLLQSQNYIGHAELRTNNPEYCRGCEIEGFCGGLCLGSLEKKFGEINVVEDSVCDFYRGITKKHIEALQPFDVATLDLGHVDEEAVV
jgi:uncharacterized protein